MNKESRDKESILVRTIINRLRMSEDIRQYITLNRKGNRAVIYHSELFEHIYQRWDYPETNKDYEFRIIISQNLVPHTYTVALAKEFR